MWIVSVEQAVALCHDSANYGTAFCPPRCVFFAPESEEGLVRRTKYNLKYAFGRLQTSDGLLTAAVTLENGDHARGCYRPSHATRTSNYCVY